MNPARHKTGSSAGGGGMADCEAEERNRRAVFAIEQMMGDWKIDLGLLKQILTGTEECHHD